ncbi:Binding-protein-dependent transport systems inner membrane component [Desulfamplus magnetovallimortis]|uniref:Binding-protein-dependent transport systems inner membrane component n=1 Tax=Desulfamplus magnetovallimortis TaxID=1246637 RepID=A0A1W1HIB6_9BACT|nr:ABC transporter permease [Desulfamplus magnetovallimortis]SLM32219.1 Binding-protein-dependent transport systems inner membrane component [Desulfamplus magnetovallimortis]
MNNILKIKTFYLFIISALLLAVISPKAEIDYISYGIFALLTLIILLISLAIYRHKKINATTIIKGTGELVWRRLAKNRTATASMIILILLSFLAILAPFITPHDPLETDWGALSQGISSSHWLGTDDMGRDIFARNLFGIRVAMGIGVTAVVLNTLIGTLLGLLAGYYGGKTDNVIMRLLEIWNAIPFILLAIAVMAALGTGIGKLILIVSLSNLMAFARIIRGSVMTVREFDYVAAAKVIGIKDFHIIIRHIIPNCISPILVLASLSIGETILVIAGLSFLGLGIQPPMPSLGGMLSNGQQFLHENLLMSIVPGVTILLIVLSFNLFGDGVRDALDSRLES